MNKKIAAIIYGDAKQNEQIVKTASQLALKMNAPIVLTQAILADDSQLFPSIHSYIRSDFDGNIDDTAQLSSSNSPQKDIEEYLEFVDPKIKTTCQVWDEDFPYMIQTVSNPIHTKIVVTEMPEKNQLWYSKRFKLGKEILELSRVPVLAVPRQCNSLNLEKPTLLVADNLVNSKNQIGDSLCFLEDLGGGYLLDAHIRTGFLENCVQRLRRQGFLQSTSRIVLNQVKKRAAIRYRINRTMEALMANQNEQDKSKGIKKNSLILDGSLIASIKDVLIRSKADIISVGQHRFFHVTNPSFGLLPVRRLSSLKKPVLISP